MTVLLIKYLFHRIQSQTIPHCNSLGYQFLLNMSHRQAAYFLRAILSQTVLPANWNEISSFILHGINDNTVEKIFRHCSNKCCRGKLCRVCIKVCLKIVGSVAENQQCWTTRCVKRLLSFSPLPFTHVLPDITISKLCQDLIFENSVWHCVYKICGLFR